MEMFVALLFPMIAAAGFKQILELVQMVGTYNRIQASLLERRFERHLRQLWSWRWRISIIILCWLAVCGAAFFLGLLGGISPMITLSGLCTTLLIWFIGLTVRTEVAMYYRILRHNERTRSLPTSTLVWLDSLGLLAKPFHTLRSEPGEETKLDAKIEMVYYYIMMIVLCFTFWLGLFPDSRILWAAILVILSGTILLAIVSHLIGDEAANKKKNGLRFLKVLTALWLILGIKLALSAALFPNFIDDMRTKFSPLLRKKATSMMMSWVTPAPDKPPTGNASNPPIASIVPPPDLNKALAGLSVAGGNPASSSINTGDTTNITNNTPAESSKKRHNLKAYLDERRAKLRVDFPDLFPNQIELPASLPAEQTIPSPLPTTNAPPLGDTLTPFGLPPVKQLP